ncbi:OmpA family protein [Actinomycetospora lemnae]|uniref:OmpA family protein n=1 Tax=Actinomycetospora lemnae TaxID=3019891 RepID=A0ABT5SYA9_9PSEU|nr:OmpA family protein [Actinomycetospora sp. DW7H6]MDD7967837.1 OmpA family protein [Actinomycetospora sp. DW7H6]
MLALLALVVIGLILLLTSRCGPEGSGPPPGQAGAPGASGQAAPGAPGAGVPGQAPPAGPAPGAAAPGGAGAPAAGAPGAAGVPEGSGTPGGAGAPGNGGGDPAAVSARVQEILAASPVTFRPDSPELTAAGARTVDQVAEELAGAPNARVTVTGYTAPVSRGIGPAAQPLSDQRAQAVAERLGREGVDPGRIEARGAADSNPRPDVAESRRVEITVS